ncbi:MAG: methyltransferase domain-containing protein [Gluconacetobacter diazotrophicus]|nr:methyltransferase domain-containing protein [Gluconacetobacter diazotrophicus]
MPNPAAPDSLSARYFDDVYRANPDPWNFASSPYEAAKYAATLAALPRALYPSAFEAGCSIGVLTAQLAPRCGRLLSADISERALRAARERCAALDNVRFEQRTLPGGFPDGPFDLIVVSEVGYYLAMPDLLKFRAAVISQLAPAGQLLLVHWTPEVHDYPLTGDEVHETFLETSRTAGSSLRHLTGRQEEKYRLDLFEQAGMPAAGRDGEPPAAPAAP